MTFSLKKHYGSIVVTLIAITPVLLWLINADSLSTQPGSLLTAFGKAAALSGLALFALNPILSMRHHFLEVIFGGIDQVFRLHARTGKISFYLICAHPLLLGAGRLVAGQSLGTIWDWTSWAFIVGSVGFVVLLIVTSVTMYAHIRHQSWILVHRLFGWLIAVFYAHALLSQAQITQNRALYYYMFTLGILGLAAFLYRSVIGKHFIKRYPYEVTEVHHLSPKITEVVLKPLSIPIDYTPGQFAYVSFVSPAVDNEPHPFSFTTANNGPYVRFMIKALGDDTMKIQGMLKGSRAFLEGPFGKFSHLRVKNKKQVWIAGGVGITPFLSMARSFSGREGFEVHFFYATESLSDAVFLQEFIDIARQLPESFITTIIAKTTSGHVGVETLQKSLTNLNDFDFLLCGPPSMTTALRDQLRRVGVKDAQIHFEAFALK